MKKTIRISKNKTNKRKKVKADRVIEKKRDPMLEKSKNSPEGYLREKRRCKTLFKNDSQTFGKER